MMQLKNIFIILLFFLLVSSLGFVSAISDDNATISINEDSILLTDENQIIKQSNNSNSFTSLNDLIANNDSSIINLDKDYLYDSNHDAVFSDGITISKSITIEGNGHTIDANNAPVRIFKITSGSVVLNNITFKNSKLESPGNAVYALSPVNITNCNFENNWAYAKEGGAVNLAGGNSIVEFCNFTQNRAKTGAAITVNSNDNCIRHSYFKDNSKDYGMACEWGSDISISSGFTSQVIYNVFLDSHPLRQTSYDHCFNNWFGDNFQPECEPLSIRNYLKAQLNCSLEGDVLKVGVQFSESDTGTIINVPWYRPAAYSIFSNTIIASTLKPASFNGVGSDAVVNVFVDNQRLTNSQGNSWYVNSSVATNGDGSQNSPFKALKRAINNAASGDTIYIAPGVYKGNNNVALTISKSLNIERWGDKGEVIFDGQSSKAIFTLKSNVVISSIIFKNANGMVGCGVAMESDSIVDDCYFVNNYASLWGGAVYVNKCRGLVINSIFENNSARYGAGAIVTNTAGLDVVNSVFSNNHANKGGAINTYDPSSSLNICNSIFKDNHANYGGAVQFEGNGCVSVTVFINNSAYLGGAVLFNADGDISDSTFINNTASLGGGGVYAWGGTHNISRSRFINSTSVDGSAILSINGIIFLNDNSFHDNCALGYGGAAYQFLGNLTVKGNEFTNNSAYYDGGALYIYKTNANIQDSVFKSNTAGYGGGAIHCLLGNLEQANVILVNNNTSTLNGHVTSSFFNSFIELGDYTMVVADTSNFTGVLPDYYNLAELGFDTPVKNQGSMGICWAYASLGAVETALKKATGITYDLSENNMKNLIARYSIYGHDRNTNRGAYVLDPVFYLASSLGPVLESDDLTDTLEFSPSLGNDFLISNIGIILRSREDPLDNDEVKQAIMKYGGVTMSLYSKNYNGYNFYQNAVNDTDHAVLIVGWDDNYSKSNFGSACPGDGAWIIKNSWGTGMGKKGYFYVSYYDTSAAWKELTYIIFNDTERYNRVYQYDYFRHRFTSSGGDVSWYRNIYTSANDEALSAFSTYFINSTDWEVYVYVEDELRHTQSGRSIGAGYYTFNFNETVSVRKGERFSVVLKVYNEVFPYVPKSMNTRPGDWGISYLSKDGVDWKDINANNHVACLKVFTKNIPRSLIHIDPIVNVTYSNTISIDFDVENRTRIGYVVKGRDGVIVSVDDFNESRILLHGLASGNYSITITNHDGNFIGCNVTANFTVFKASSSVEILEVKNGVYNTGNASFIINFTNSTNLTVMIHHNNQKILEGDYMDLASLLGGLNVGDYSITIVNNGDENHSSSNASAFFSVLKASSRIIASDAINLTYQSLQVIDFEILNHTASSFILKTMTGEIIISETPISTNRIALSNISPGEYELVIFNGENDFYMGDVKSVNLSIAKALNNAVLIVENTTLPGNVSVKVKSNVTGIYTVNIGSYKVNVTVGGAGEGSSSIRLPCGNYTASIGYMDDQNYIVSSDDVMFGVVKAINRIRIEVESFTYPGEGIIKVSADVSGEYIVSINGTEYNVIVLEDNSTAFKSITLKPGRWMADICSYYHDDYEGLVIGDEFSVLEGEITELKILISNVTYPNRAFAIVHASVDGNYTVNVGGKNYSLTVYDGMGVSGEFELLDCGTYDAIVISNVDYYGVLMNRTSFDVFKANASFSFDDVDVNFMAQPYFINISGENPYEMSCHIYDTGGKLIFNSTFDGNEIFVLPKLADGNYSIVLSTMGDRNHDPVSRQYMVNVVNRLAPTLNATAVVDGFNVDITVKTRAEGYICLSFNGLMYKQNIADGEARFRFENLHPNTYVMSLFFVGSDAWSNSTESLNFTVDKQSAMISAPNAAYSIVYGGTYTVKTNAPNNVVSFKINGKTYNIKSDAAGVAKIKFTKAMLVKTGTKTLTVTVDGKYYINNAVTSKIAVKKEKTKFTAKKSYRFKNSKKTKKIKVTLKDSKKKAVKKVKVTLKIKGKKVKGKKTFALKTNKKGVVTFKITSKKTKFLKKGKYSASITFKGNGNYNKVTKKVKLVIR